MPYVFFHELTKLAKERHFTLVVVSKTQPIERIRALYDLGHRVFGENRVQELTDKQEALPKDVEWHLIGHLQTNKVKYIAPFVSLIHSVDSLKLAAEIDKQAAKNDRVIPILLQVFIADEETKFGFGLDELQQLMEENSFENFKNIKVVGLMGMATNTDNEAQIKQEFDSLNSLYKNIQQTHNQLNINLEVLSMGMSGDYEIALDAGSNMVRVGSLIFKY